MTNQYSDLLKDNFNSMFQDPREDGWGHQWRASQRFRLRFYLKFAKEFITKTDPHVLDIGCGYGDFLRIFKKEFEDACIYGCDISEKAIEQNEQILPWGIFFKRSLPFFYSMGLYHTIFCFDTIYYLGKDAQIQSLEDINGSLVENAFAFLSIPTREMYWEEFVTMVHKSIEVIEFKFNYAWLYTIIERPFLRLYKRFKLKPIKWLLGIKWPVVVCFWLSKAINKHSHIIVMARKRCSSKKTG